MSNPVVISGELAAELLEYFAPSRHLSDKGAAVFTQLAAAIHLSKVYAAQVPQVVNMDEKEFHKAALTGILTKQGSGLDDTSATAYCRNAYVLADRMLAEREKTYVQP